MIPIRDQPGHIQIVLKGSLSPIRLDLVYLVCLVHPVDLVYLV